MTFRRRPPQQQRDERHSDEYREPEQYDMDDARHFATRVPVNESEFARRGQSHEEHMRGDNSRRPARAPGAPGDYYGSGGSYGYGGGFEHGGQRGVGDAYRRGGNPGRGNEEFYEATGGFGHDVSGYGRAGLGYPGQNEYRRGFSGASEGDRWGPTPRSPRRPPFAEDRQQGFAQDAGYAQSGGERQGEELRQRRAYGPDDRPDVRGLEGGGRGGEHAGPRIGGRPSASSGRMPKNYTRSDERIREDLCDRLGHGEVDPSEVSVRVESGIVTLEGSVDSRYAKYQVEELADSVMGVREVENRLRVTRPGQQAAAPESGTAKPSGERASGEGQRDAAHTPGTNGARG